MNATALKLVENIEQCSYELKTGSFDAELELNPSNLNSDFKDNHKAKLIHRAKVAWSWLGDSSKPVVVVLGGISANRIVAYDGLVEDFGWWEQFVGISKAIDTTKFSVLSFNYIGGNEDKDLQLVSQNKLNITTHTQAKALQLLLNKLHITKVNAVVGCSYGGMVSLAFAESFPDRLDKQIVISAADRSHPRSTALRLVQRQIVELGLKTGEGCLGLALARQLGMITYRSKEEFCSRYETENVADGQQQLINYLDFSGTKFAKKFNPNAYLCLSESIDSHHVSPEKIKTPTSLISVDSDELVFPNQLQQLSQCIGAEAEHIVIKSSFGHDAFLKEEQIIKPLLQRLLETRDE